MVAFLQKHDAPFDLTRLRRLLRAHRRAGEDDLSRLHRLQARVRQPGTVLLQTLNILENFDLHAMGTRSADYLHTLVEAMKLAYADRDSYYADPAFVKVPAEGLLSKAYAKERAALIDPKHASTSFIAGDPTEVRLAGEGVDVLEGRRQGRHDRNAERPNSRGWRRSDWIPPAS